LGASVTPCQPPLKSAIFIKNAKGSFFNMLLALALVAAQNPMASWPTSRDVEPHEKEVHLRNIKQLTFGGQNAEAYWNVEGTQLVFQTAQPGFPDEQIFVMNADGSGKRLASTGLGRCTCGYFSPDGKWIYFSSTHTHNEGPQKPIDRSQGYVWMVNPDFDLYRVRVDEARSDGEDRNKIWEPILRKPGYYIAETTIAPNGEFLTFTATIGGDLNIFRANLDGGDIRQLTNEFGYDGGPFVSWDSQKIVYRRSELRTQEEREDYKSILAKHLVRPGRLEVWIMDADGGNKRQVTNLGAASFAPFLHPDGERIIFSSNYGDPTGREFDLFMINVDGTGLKRVTYTGDFDGFPMFSRDGKKLAFSSNRHGTVRGETNVFVADWVD
jgi:TolB protein